MISIALATYNGERYIGEQLDSIAHQTKLPDELVISDDCSTDSTLNIVNKFSQGVNFPVKVLINKERLGSTGNFEIAINSCSGDIIFPCDQDDVWYPDKIARIEECLLNNTEAGAVFTDADVVDQNLKLLKGSLWERLEIKQQELIKITTHKKAFKVLLNRNIVTGATMAFRAEYRNSIVPIPKDWVHDAWIALVISLSSKLIALQIPLIAYRQHESNQIGAPPFSFFSTKKNKNGGKSFKTIYLPRVKVCQSALRRLTESSSNNTREIKDKILQINDELTFYYARHLLPNNRLKRIPIILKQLIACRYHRHTKGTKHAVKDLLRLVKE